MVVVDGDKAIPSPVRAGKIAELMGKLPATRPDIGSAEIRREVGSELGKSGVEPNKRCGLRNKIPERRANRAYPIGLSSLDTRFALLGDTAL